jgi:uncharacterized membrane protein
VNYWKVILATVVIFATGVMTGGLLVNYVERAHPKNSHRAPATVAALPHTNSPAISETNNLGKPRLPEIWSKEFVGHLNDELLLAPDQREKIEKIIAVGQELNHAIWTNNSAQMRKVVQDARQQIREQLTPDQRNEFEELMKRPPRKPSANTNAPANLLLSPPTNAPGI